MSTAPNTPSRAVYLDVFKTILIFIMVTAHVIQVLDLERSTVEGFVSLFANASTFHGFFFAFGIGVAINPKKVSKLHNWGKPLTFYVSYILMAFAYFFLVDHKSITLSALSHALQIKILLAYSEPLASFFVLSVIIALFKKQILAYASLPLLLFSFMISAILSFFPPDISPVPLLPTLIGYRFGCTFPVVQYFPWFILGILYAKKRFALDWNTGLCAFALSATTAFYSFLSGGLPTRDPPQLLWIIGPALILFCYLLIAQHVAPYLTKRPWLAHAGKNALYYYVGSSLLIFCIEALTGKLDFSIITTIPFVLALITVLYAFKTALDLLLAQLKQRRPSHKSILSIT